MKTTAKWQLTVGLMVVTVFAGAGQCAAAISSATAPSFTIHMRNAAGVDVKTLKLAEEVASGIFQKAGVVSQWVDAPVTSEDLQQASAEPQSFGLSQIRVNILPPAMSDRMSIPAGVTGLAPGAGSDRLLAYVFYGRVGGLAEREIQRQVAAQAKGNAALCATEAQILGVVMAHEIGHILLNLSVHTETGIMRGKWDLRDLSDIAEGYLGFTKQQGEVIQAEVARRAHQQNVLNAGSRSETPVLANQ